MTKTPLSAFDAILERTSLAEVPSQWERDVFRRVYSTSQSTYVQRLRRIGFSGRSHVLDAGSGYGQWSLALAEVNERVTAMDLSSHRSKILRATAGQQGVRDLSVARGRLEQLPFADQAFDAVFSYSAVFFTELGSTLPEVARVLRPGGLFYLTANDIGWYIYNLIEGHHSAVDRSTRRAAVLALLNGVRHFLGWRPHAGEMFIPVSAMRRALVDAGFRDVRTAEEGTLGSDTVGARPFFAGRKYGLLSVYEVLCSR